MKASVYRDQTEEELRQTYRDLCRELFDLRVMQGAGGAGGVMKIRGVKRDIARVKTVMKERGIS